MLLSMLLGAAVLLFAEAAPTEFTSQPLSFPSSGPDPPVQLQEVMTKHTGSGSGAHYQSLGCKTSLTTAETATVLAGALKSMQSNLSRIVNTTFTALNFSSKSEVSRKILAEFQFPNLNFTDISSHRSGCSSESIEVDLCSIRLLVPDMKCIGHLLGQILLDATDVQINTGANNTFRSELYKTYASVNFTVELERMVQNVKCNLQLSCFPPDKICPSYKKLNVTISPSFAKLYDDMQLTQLRKTGILYKIEQAYGHLQDILNHYSDCDAAARRNKVTI